MGEWRYQNREIRVLVQSLAALYALALLNVFLKNPSTFGIAFLMIATVVIAFFGYRPVSAEVTVTAEGVSIRNLLRNIQVGWDQVSSFSFGARGLNASIGVAVLNDGRELSITAIQGPPLFPHSKRAQRAREAIDRLNNELSQHRR